MQNGLEFHFPVSNMTLLYSDRSFDHDLYFYSQDSIENSFNFNPNYVNNTAIDYSIVFK